MHRPRLSAHFLVLLVLLVASSAYASPDFAVETWDQEDGTLVIYLFDDRIPMVDVSILFPVSSYMPWIVEHDGETAFSMQTSGWKLRRERKKLGISISADLGPVAAELRGSSFSSDFSQLLELLKKVMSSRFLRKSTLPRSWRATRLNWKVDLKDPQFARLQLAAHTIFQDDSDPRRLDFERPKRPSFDIQRHIDTRDAILRVPGRIITISGDVKRDVAREAVHNLLPPPEVSTITELTFPPLAQINSGLVKTAKIKHLTQAYIALIRGSLPTLSDDFPAFLLVNIVLGGHFESRLSSALRTQEGDTYSARVIVTGRGTESGMLLLSTFTRTTNESSAVSKMKTVLRELHRGGITEAERESALRFLVGREVFRQETPFQVVRTRAFSTIKGRAPEHRETVLKRACILTLDEINTFVKRYYDPDKFALVRVVSK